MGSARGTPLGALDLFQGCLQVFDAAMKIVRRTEEHNRAGDSLQVRIIADHIPYERVFVATMTDSPARGCSGLDPFIRPSGHDRQFSTHGMAVHAQLVTIHPRLLFKEGQRSTSAHRGEEPGIVTWRRHTVQRMLVRGTNGEPVHIPERCMVPVQCAPVSRQFVIGIIGLAIPEELHNVGIHLVVRRIDPTGP